MGLFSIKNSPKEYAKVIDWSPMWDAGAPSPQVFSNGHRAFLIYYLDTPDPDWDGTYTRMIDPSSDEIFDLALVEFKGCHSYRFGIVNDEASQGHPLAGRGLETYAAHIVQNSQWIEELKTIHKVHPYFREENWHDYKHYLFFFHDDMLEIVAKEYKIETFKSTFSMLGIDVVKRLNV